MKSSGGFTLIELLVVIAVIGLLASVVMASLNAAREKSRDATRKSDLQQIARALELYYNDHRTYRVAGTGASGNGIGFFSCDSDNAGAQLHCGTKSVSQGLVEANALSGNIVDPLGVTDNFSTNNIHNGYMLFVYDEQTSGYTGTPRFALWTTLERPSDAEAAMACNLLPNTGYDDYHFGFNEEDKTNFCITN